MDLTVRYQPPNEAWFEFEIEKGIIINKQRNQFGKAQIKLPQSYAVREGIEHGNVQILYRNHYLFDGTIEKNIYSRDNIIFSCYDQLYPFKDKDRIFVQSITDITPSELVTDLFDQNGTSSYVTGYYGENYTAHGCLIIMQYGMLFRVKQRMMIIMIVKEKPLFNF
ncbi:MAG: hypothetical protein ACFFC6_05185 [Promethearchaeota archaeon]